MVTQKNVLTGFYRATLTTLMVASFVVLPFGSGLGSAPVAEAAPGDELSLLSVVSDCQNPDPENDLDVISFDSENGTAEVENTSDECDYDVGLASYEKYDNQAPDDINTQVLHDSDTTTIAAGDSENFSVNLPSCAYQIDLFHGDLIESFFDGDNEIRYNDNNRLLDYGHEPDDRGATKLDDLCTPPQQDMSELRICKVLVDESGDITAGEEDAATFSVEITGPDSYEETIVFDTELDYNEDFFSANGGTDDVMCQTLTLAPGDYYYDEEMIDSDDGYAAPGYNDGEVGDLDDFYEYGEHDNHSDGHIVLRKDKDRTLTIKNQLEDEVAQCSLNADDYDHFIDFIDEDNTLIVDSNLRTNDISVSIPAGNYEVTLESFDDHDDQNPPQDQNSERYVLELRDGSTIVATSSASGGTSNTDDLKDDEVNASFSGVVNANLSLLTAVDTVVGAHAVEYPSSLSAPADDSPNSVKAICAGLNEEDGQVAGTSTEVTITGFKFSDDNGNANFNAGQGEQKLAGWEFRLYDETFSTTTASDTTGNGGRYQFSDLDPGTYNVCEVEQSGFSQTLPNVSSSNAVANLSGASDEGAFCYEVTVTDSDEDQYINGLRFGNEPDGAGGNGGDDEGSIQICKAYLDRDGNLFDPAGSSADDASFTIPGADQSDVNFTPVKDSAPVATTTFMAANGLNTDLNGDQIDDVYCETAEYELEMSYLYGEEEISGPDASGWEAVGRNDQFDTAFDVDNPIDGLTDADQDGEIVLGENVQQPAGGEKTARQLIIVNQLTGEVLGEKICEADILHFDTHTGDGVGSLFAVEPADGDATNLLETYPGEFHSVIADEGDTTLYAIRTDGMLVTLDDGGSVTEIGTVESSLQKPVAMDFGADGTLYVLDQQGNELFEIDASDASTITKGKVANSAQDKLGVAGGDLVATVESGEIELIYVHKDGTVYAIDPDDAPTASFETLGTLSNDPMHITSATKQDNTFYALDRENKNDDTDGTLYTFEVNAGSIQNVTTETETGPYHFGDGTCAEAPEEEVAQCTPGEEYATSVEMFAQGDRNNGSSVLAGRSDSADALDTPDDEFVSLGFGGEIILEFAEVITNGVGDDFQVFETTNGSSNTAATYPETADVYVSNSLASSSFEFVGTATLDDDSFDLASSTLSSARYVKLVDTTDENDPAFNGQADGFDLDAVTVINCDDESGENGNGDDNGDDDGDDSNGTSSVTTTSSGGGGNSLGSNSGGGGSSDDDSNDGGRVLGDQDINDDLSRAQLIDMIKQLEAAIRDLMNNPAFGVGGGNVLGMQFPTVGDGSLSHIS